jgi:acetyl-CoA carboxylase beta subunit
MLEIRKTYVTDSKKRPVAVQIDIQTFERIEQLLEDYALGQFISENDPTDTLSVAEAKAYYETLVQKK